MRLPLLRPLGLRQMPRPWFRACGPVKSRCGRECGRCDSLAEGVRPRPDPAKDANSDGRKGAAGGTSRAACPVRKGEGEAIIRLCRPGLPQSEGAKE